MTDREEAGQPPRSSWGGVSRHRMFAVRFQATTMTLGSILAALTVSTTLVLPKAFYLSEAATIASREAWVGLILLAAIVLSLKA